MKEDNRVLTPITAEPNSHTLICDSGALPELMWVLKNQQDGDGELEELRDMVSRLNKVAKNIFSDQSKEVFHQFKKEIMKWAKKVDKIWI